jgi:6-phosphogluconolactonase (cycloisomerase 2 family)
MTAWSPDFPKHCYVCFIVLALSLCHTACGGGSGSSTSGGSGVDKRITPASGEYLWENASGPALYYSAINDTTGALGTPTIAGGPASTTTIYPTIIYSPFSGFLYAFWESFSLLNTFQMSGPDLQLNQMTARGYTISVPFASSMTIHPGGKFLYVITTPGVGVIQEISISSDTGAMTLGPVVMEPNADLRLGIVDPSGNFLFVNDLTQGRIFVYKIDQTDGTLTAAANSPFTLPLNEQPTFIAIGGSGASLYLYADLYASEGIAAFSINSSTGALSSVSGSPFQTGISAPDYICVEPSGRFLYSSISIDGTIIGLAINPSDGTLSPVPGSPFSTAPTSDSIAIDPSGRFLYTANYLNSTIYGFSLDSATGRLSALANSPFPSVQQPRGLTIMKIP